MGDQKRLTARFVETVKKAGKYFDENGLVLVVVWFMIETKTLPLTLRKQQLIILERRKSDNRDKEFRDFYWQNNAL